MKYRLLGFRRSKRRFNARRGRLKYLHKWRSKLTATEWQDEAFRAVLAGGGDYSEAARRLGVCQESIRTARRGYVRRITWRFVTCEITFSAALKTGIPREELLKEADRQSRFFNELRAKEAYKARLARLRAYEERAGFPSAEF
jgi:hypothetical protein